jgi:hypothetical protein
MGTLMIVNGSPRAPRSNSKKYGELAASYWDGVVLEYSAIAKKRETFYNGLEKCDDLLFVFPLYADGLPVPLLELLKEMEAHDSKQKPTVHVLINCGFLEPEQNLVAANMMHLFCRQNGYPVGTTLCIGAGEAILNTPFRHLVKWSIKKMVKGIKQKKGGLLKVTMPISKRMFIKASESYWIKYGKKNDVSKEQMESMQIELW